MIFLASSYKYVCRSLFLLQGKYNLDVNHYAAPSEAWRFLIEIKKTEFGQKLGDLWRNQRIEKKNKGFF